MMKGKKKGETELGGRCIGNIPSLKLFCHNIRSTWGISLNDFCDNLNLLSSDNDVVFFTETGLYEANVDSECSFMYGTERLKNIGLKMGQNRLHISQYQD